MLNKLGVCIRLQLRILLWQSAGRLGGGRKAARGGLLALIAGLLLYLSVFYSKLMLESFPVNDRSLLIYLMSAAAVAMVFLTSIQLAQGTLFGFRDFDFLMSLPISRATVMLSKLASFLLICYGYSGFLYLPAMILYGVNVSAQALYYVMGAVGFLFLPLVPMVVSGMIALAIRVFAARSRWRSFVTNGLSFLVFLAVLAGSMTLSMASEGMTAIDLSAVRDSLIRFLPFVGLYAKGIVEQDGAALLGSIAISAAAFALFVFIFNQTFIKVNGGLQEGYHVRNFRLTAWKRSGALDVLFQKELRKFLGNFMYVMNLAIGQILLIGGAAYALLNKAALMEALGSAGPQLRLEATSTVFLLSLGLILFFGMMSNTAAVSLSLEGKNLWIVRSLPIRTEDLFLSKILVNAAVIALPSLIGFLLMALAFDFSLVMILIGLGFIAALGFFVGTFGLWINLLFPRLEFEREILVIKQSASSFIAVFGGMLLGMGGLFLLFWLADRLDAVLLAAAAALLLAGLAWLLWQLLITVGAKIYQKL